MVGQVAGEDYPGEAEHGLHKDRGQQEIARDAKHRRAVGKNERGHDIAGRLLGHPHKRCQCYLLRLALQRFPDRRAHDALLCKHLPEDRRFEDPEPDP